MLKIKQTTLALAVVMLATTASSQDTITIYSTRQAHLLAPLLREFSKDSGIKVHSLTGKGATLIERLKLEGSATSADLFMTVDAGNLWYAASQNLLQPAVSPILQRNIPPHLRDPSHLWFGLSVRARTMVYHGERVSAQDLSTYADLASRKWHGRLCLRTAKKIYTKSLVTAIIHHKGSDKTAAVVKGWVDNLAATPYAKDGQIMDAIAAGQCDVGLVNSYYYAQFLEKNPATPLRIFWANQATSGVHVNVSGAGITRYAPHPKRATQLLEYLASDKAQAIYSKLNKEYPANPQVPPDPALATWGNFRQDTMNLSQVGKLQETAVRLMQKQGYK